MRLLVFLLTFVSLNALADEWRTADSWMLGTALAMTAIDWGQTRYIVKTRQQTSDVWACVNTGPVNATSATATCAKPEAPRAHYETNPILGRQPSLTTVDRYFAASMIATAGLAFVLPQTQRRWMLGGIITVEAFVVLRNHELGIRIEF
jgi:hypothetical protein